MPDKTPLEHATRPAIIPATADWAVVHGIYLGDDVPVLAWNFDEGRPRPITVYGVESGPVILRHGRLVYHPNGHRESWEDYESRTVRLSSQRKGTACPRR